MPAPKNNKSSAETQPLVAPHVWLFRERQFLSATENSLILAPLAAQSSLAQRIKSWRDALFAAQKVNTSEARAAGHWALRRSGLDEAFGADNPIQNTLSYLPTRFSPDQEDLMPRMREAQRATRELAREILEHKRRASDGKPFTHVLHLGIGGSDTGPRLLIDALMPTPQAPSEARNANAKNGQQNPRGLDACFLSNLDYHGISRTLATLDPHRTLVVVASKSFSTLETLANAAHCRRWMQAHGVQNWPQHYVAVTSQPDAACAWGIAPDQVLWFDESIGGRFSLWGPVSLAARLTLGNTAIDEFLLGGCEMDQHFLSAPLQENLPAVLAAGDFYNLRTRNLPTLMLSAYDSRLALLVPYLKQLWMESLGKQVDLHGNPIDGYACPILWGDVGTNAQHAFFQLLHQGTQGVAVELLGIARAEHSEADSHRALLANLLAQAQALSIGQQNALAERVCLGGHPVNLMFLDCLSPRALGALIALWEHRVLCLAAFSQVNPFDQWGVEAGKTIARAADEALARPGPLKKQGQMPGAPEAQENLGELDSESLRVISWLQG